MTCNGRLPAMTNTWESTNVPDLYFAGTLMQVLDYQKTHSNVIHGFRFNIKAMSQMFGQKYHSTPIPPYLEINFSAGELAAYIIHRVSTDAGMFQQQGFLGDLIILDKDQQKIRYYHGLPIAYIHESAFGKEHCYYTITMEFGHSDQDPFSIAREKDPDKAQDDFYLHPMIRRLDQGNKLYEYHLPEHLENDWRPDEFPGSKALLRSIEYIGQKDHSLFQKSYLEKLQAFLVNELV